MRVRCPIPVALHSGCVAHGNDGMIDALWDVTEEDGTRGTLVLSKNCDVVLIVLGDEGDGSKYRPPASLVLALSRSQAYDLARHLVAFNDGPEWEE